MVGSAATGGLVRPATAGQIAELEELYAQIPAMDCLGRCQEACGPIGMGDAEYARLQQAGMPPIRRANQVGVDFKAMSCPALTMFGQCSVYLLRPMICRIWGAVASMRCKHGCRPEGGLLPELDGQVLLMKAMQVGATPKERRRLDALIGRLTSDPEMSEAMATYVLTKNNSGLSREHQEDIIAAIEQLLARKLKG